MKKIPKRLSVEALSRFIADNENVMDYQFNRFVCLL